MPIDKPIAIFDSGVGGLSIYKAIKKILPQEQIVYLADGAHFPYGDKSPAQVRRFALACLKFLIYPVRCPSEIIPHLAGLSHGAKLIVVACNTATVSGLDFYRKKLPNIPIIGVVPVVKTAVEKTKNNRIAIISTVATANSAYQKKLIARFCPSFHVFNLTSPTSLTSRISPISPTFQPLLLNIACPHLVSFVERGVTEGRKIENELRQILAPVIDAKCDVLALGCTHYPFLKKTINKMTCQGHPRAGGDPALLILDPSAAVARHAKRILENNHLLCSPSLLSVPSLPSPDLFLTTGNPENFEKSIKKLLKINVPPKQVII